LTSHCTFPERVAATCVCPKRARLPFAADTRTGGVESLTAVRVHVPAAAALIADADRSARQKEACFMGFSFGVGHRKRRTFARRCQHISKRARSAQDLPGAAAVC